jgi:hypothetical protein
MHQLNGDIARACQNAIIFAEHHQETILYPLGTQTYGNNSWYYKAEDVCPF